MSEHVLAPLVSCICFLLGFLQPVRPSPQYRIEYMWCLGVPSANLASDGLEPFDITVKPFSIQLVSFRCFDKLVRRETFFLPFRNVYIEESIKYHCSQDADVWLYQDVVG